MPNSTKLLAFFASCSQTKAYSDSSKTKVAVDLGKDFQNLLHGLSNFDGYGLWKALRAASEVMQNYVCALIHRTYTCHIWASLVDHSLTIIWLG